jgi:hypothetical protein
MTKQQALEYVERTVGECIPKTRPEYGALQHSLRIAVERIWASAINAHCITGRCGDPCLCGCERCMNAKYAKQA